MESGGIELARAVRATRRREQLGGLVLVAPAVVFLLLVFVAPIALFAWRSVDNAEAWSALPRTRTALAAWDGVGLPPEPAVAALRRGR